MKTNIKLELTSGEKQELRKNGLRIRDTANYTAQELEAMLHIPATRAREIHALAAFQSIPTVGIAFAQDLVDMGYYSVSELRGKDGAQLTEDFERLKGYWIDPCVEDQFRLVVHYADTGDTTKRWWDFTETRKQYRTKHGYPKNRPGKAWHETLGYTIGGKKGG